jgi:hypothetical protein
MTELCLMHFSVQSWGSPKLWADYLGNALEILGTKLKYLDTNDPARRGFASLGDAGQFVADRGSELLFGKCQARGVDFSVQHFNPLDSCANSFKWYLPTPETERKIQAIRNLFDLGNVLLGSFYSVADLSHHIAEKKKRSGAVDLQTELPGLFWLTHFNKSYVNFFGAGKIALLPGLRWDPKGGGTTVLAEHPSKLSQVERRKLEEAIGGRSFVDPSDSRGKLMGQSALTFSQLGSPSPASE